MPYSQMSDVQEKIRRFIRGDLSGGEFEEWIYDTPEVEALCGPHLFIELLSVDYRDTREVERIRDGTSKLGRL